MKQHITVEQLFELQDYKLAEVMDEEFQNAVRNLNCNPYMSDTEKDNLIEVLAEQVTIGKMIEILYNHTWQVTIGKMIEILYNHTCDIVIESAGCNWYVDINTGIYKSRELCDALWEAVKEVL
ncbi:MAG: hypothetical protein PWQ37_14 [Candidatus Petromonas sp.]|jgi:hypothetical protein|nr:hypothetical protein [Candidatus Petromonas sp.]